MRIDEKGRKGMKFKRITSLILVFIMALSALSGVSPSAWGAADAAPASEESQPIASIEEDNGSDRKEPEERAQVVEEEKDGSEQPVEEPGTGASVDSGAKAHTADEDAVYLTGREPLVTVAESADEPLLAPEALSTQTRRTLRAGLRSGGETSVTVGAFTLNHLQVLWVTNDTGTDTLVESTTDSDFGYFQFQLQFVIESQGYKKVEAGALEIVLPGVLFKDRSGAAAGTLELAVPEAPASNANFAWTRVDDHIVITNLIDIAGGSFVMVQGTFSGYEPSEIKGYVPATEEDEAKNLSEPFLVRVGLEAPVTDEETQETSYASGTLTSGTIYAGIQTGIQVNTVAKRASNVYNVNGGSYGSVPEAVRPAEPDDYIYVQWALSATVAGDQYYTMTLTDEISQEERADGAVMLGATGLTAAYNDDSTVVLGTDTDEDGKPDTLICNLVKEDYTTLLRSATIWTAYPRRSDAYATGSLSTVKNAATVSVTGLDDGKVSTKTSGEVSKTFTAPATPVYYHVSFDWNDAGSKGTRPAQYLYIYKNNSLWRTVNLTAANAADDDYTYSFSDDGIPGTFTFRTAIRSGASGSSAWTVTETAPRERSRYNWTYKVMTADNTDVYDPETKTHTVTIHNSYSHTMETQREYTVLYDWTGDAGLETRRPATTIYVYRNGGSYTSLSVSAANAQNDDYSVSFWDSGSTADTFTVGRVNTNGTYTGWDEGTDGSGSMIRNRWAYSVNRSWSFDEESRTFTVQNVYSPMVETQRLYTVKFSWTGDETNAARPGMYVYVHKNGSSWKRLDISASSVRGNDNYSVTFWDDGSESDVYTIGSVAVMSGYATSGYGPAWTDDGEEERTRYNWLYTLKSDTDYDEATRTFTITNHCAQTLETQYLYHVTFEWQDTVDGQTGTRPGMTIRVYQDSALHASATFTAAQSAGGEAYSFYGYADRSYTVSVTGASTPSQWVESADGKSMTLYEYRVQTRANTYEGSSRTYTVYNSYTKTGSTQYRYTLHAEWDDAAYEEKPRGSGLTVRVARGGYNSTAYLYPDAWADTSFWSYALPGSGTFSLTSAGYGVSYRYDDSENSAYFGTRFYYYYTYTSSYDAATQTYTLTSTLNETQSPYQYYAIAIDWDDNDNEYGHRPGSLGRAVYVYQNGGSFVSGGSFSAEQWKQTRIRRENDGGQDAAYTWTSSLSSGISGITDWTTVDSDPRDVYRIRYNWRYSISSTAFDRETNTFTVTLTYSQTPDRQNATALPSNLTGSVSASKTPDRRYDTPAEAESGYRLLNKLLRGETVSMEYAASGTAYVLPYLLNEDAGTPRIMADYTTPTEVSLADTGLTLNGTALTGGDYQISYVELQPARTYTYRQVSGYFSNWSWTTTAVTDSTIPVRLYGRALGEESWTLYATLQNGSVTVENGASSSGAVVTLPDGVEQISVQSNSAAHAIIHAYTATVTVKPSDHVLALIEAPLTASATNEATLPLVNSVKLSAADGAMAQTRTATVYMHGMNFRVAARMVSTLSKTQDYYTKDYDITISATMTQQSNYLSQDAYDEARESGFLITNGSGVWYDLLPMGVQPVVDADHPITAASGDRIVDYSVRQNFRNTGRTLLTVWIDYADHITYNETNSVGKGFPSYGGKNTRTISFQCRLLGNDIYAYKLQNRTMYNYIVYEADEEELGDYIGLDGAESYSWKGEADDPSGTGNYGTVLAFPEADGESDEIKLALTDLDATRDDPSFLYAYNTIKPEGNFSALWSSANTVSLDAVSWSRGAYEETEEPMAVYEGSPYVYRLQTGVYNSSVGMSEIVFFDVLDDFEPRDEDPAGNTWLNDKGRWKGALESVDTSQLRNMGCAPVVYYTAEDAAELVYEDGDELLAAMRAGEDGWVTEENYSGAMSAVTAVAIDATWDGDGGSFVIRDDFVQVYIHMTAPVDPQGVFDETTPGDASNNAFAYNISSVGYHEGEIRHFESFPQCTGIGILPFSYDVRVDWDDTKNNDAMRPESIVAAIYQNDPEHKGEPYQTLTLTGGADEDSWSAASEHVARYASNGDRYSYTVVWYDGEEQYEVEGEQAAKNTVYTASDSDYVTDVNTGVMTGSFTLSHTLKRIDVPFTKVWEGEDGWTEDRPSSITVRLYADGIMTANAKTVRPSDNWAGEFTNVLKYSAGSPIAYTVREDEVYRYSPAYETDGGGAWTITNSYYPFGDLLITNTLSNATEAAQAVEFTYELSLLEADGIFALDGAFEYEKTLQDGTTEEGTIASGDTFTLKGAESLLIKVIPSEGQYIVTERSAGGRTLSYNASGFQLTGRTGASGSIRAGRTQTAAFTNTYRAAGQVSFSAVKTLAGRTLARNQFKFELYTADGENETVLRTSYNAPDGSVTLGTLSYTVADVGQTRRYFIREVNENASGYEYDDTIHEITVAVTDPSGVGRLGLAVTCESEGAETTDSTVQAGSVASGSAKAPFTNHYSAEGMLTLSAQSLLGIDAPEAGKFRFRLLDDTGAVVRLDDDGNPVETGGTEQKKENDGEGMAVFDAIRFTNADLEPRLYVVAELETDETDADYRDERIVYDRTVRGFRVTPSDNGDGTLSFAQTSVNVKWVESGGRYVVDPDSTEDPYPLFRNAWKPGTLEVAKILTDAVSGVEDTEFDMKVQFRGSDGVEVPEEISYTIEEDTAGNGGAAPALGAPGRILRSAAPGTSGRAVKVTVEPSAPEEASADAVEDVTEAAPEPVVIESETEAPKLLATHTHDLNGYGDPITFTEWTSATSLPSSAGSYYLANNVTISSTWTVSADITLCLNGHQIRRSGTGRVINVNSGYTFTICDCYDASTHTGAEYTHSYTNPVTSTSKNVTGGLITGGSTSEVGAGIYASGFLKIYGGAVAGNRSTSSDGGGGIYFYKTTLWMYGGAINDNYASSGSCGGVYVQDSTFYLSGGEVSGNKCLGIGGGVGVGYYSTFNMTGGTISNNISSQSGGGVSVNNATFNLSAGTITGNRASSSGGGVWRNSGTFRYSSAAVITDNSPSNITGSATQVDLHMHQLKAGDGDAYTFTATSTLPSSAGNYYLTADVTTGHWTLPAGTTRLCLNGHQIKRNGLALNNPIITVSAGRTLIICDCYNAATHTGTEYTHAYTSPVDGEARTVNGGLITGGRTNQQCGAISVSGGAFALYGGTIAGNRAATYAGAVYVSNGGSFTMEGGEISDNLAGTNSGAVDVTGSTFAMHGGKISGNKASGGYAGGVGVFYNTSSGGTGSFTMTGGEISGNQADFFAGGVLVSGGIFTMSGSARITGNTAGSFGGGVDVRSVSNAEGIFTMTGGEISGNSATTAGGGVHVGEADDNGGVRFHGTFRLAGSAVISGNTLFGGASAVTNNVYLVTDAIDITGALTEGASIGVSMASPGVFTSGYRSGGNLLDPDTYFFADDGSSVMWYGDSEAMLASITILYHSLVATQADYPVRYGLSETVTVMAGDGFYDASLYDFRGWTKTENGSTVDCSPGETFDFTGYNPGDTMPLWPVVESKGYRVEFHKSAGVIGSMSTLTGLVLNAELTLPACEFSRYGYSFKHWVYCDEDGVAVEGSDSVFEDEHTFPDGMVNSAGQTPADGETIHLLAVLTKDTHTQTLTDGALTISLRGGYKAVFADLPAGVTYQVTETVPSGWVQEADETTSGTIPANGLARAVFTNRYTPTGTSASFAASVTLDGSAPAGGRFRFRISLTKDGSDVTGYPKFVDNGTGGAIPVETLAFTGPADVGTYIYSITQTDMTDDTISYDGRTMTLTTVVTASGASLSAAVTGSAAFLNRTKTGGLRVTSRNTNGAAGTTFTYDLALTNGAGQAVTKELNGTLYNADDTAAGTTVSAVNGEARFTLGSGQYIVFDYVPAGTRYAVTQTARAGWTSAQSGMSGVIASTVRSEALAVNTYHPGSVTGATVSLETFYTALTGATLAQGQFSFTITQADSGGSPVEGGDSRQVVNGALDVATTIMDGEGLPIPNPHYNQARVSFADLSYTGDAAGTYYYIVEQTDKTDETIAYSDKRVLVTVTVTDNGAGVLSASAVYDTDDYLFSSAMKPGMLKVTKEAPNLTAATRDKLFAFTLELRDASDNALTGSYTVRSYDGDGVEQSAATVSDGGTVSIKGGWWFIVEGLPHGSAYTVTEGALAGFTISQTIAAEGVIQAGRTAEAVVTNIYSAAGTLKLPVALLYTGAAVESGQFQFAIYDSEDNELNHQYVTPEETTREIPEGKTEEIDVGHGSVTFTLNYALGDTAEGSNVFVYKVKQLVPEDRPEYLYCDEHVAEITVTVTDNGDGTVTATPSYETDALTFENAVVDTFEMQICATVPLYVCMYVYGGDGKVVAPSQEAYQIVNHSNCALQVLSVRGVDRTVGGSGASWALAASSEGLRAREMYMTMMGESLSALARDTSEDRRWSIAAPDMLGPDGLAAPGHSVPLPVPISAVVAGGSVNEGGESRAFTVVYTVQGVR